MHVGILFVLSTACVSSMLRQSVPVLLLGILHVLILLFI